MSNELLNRMGNYIKSAEKEDIELLETIIEAFEKSKQDNSTLLSNMIQMKPQMKEDGTCHCRIPITKLIKNFINTVHGGITATLVDTTMGRLVINDLSSDEFTVTAELKINYLKPGNEGSLTCVASSIHRGKKIHVCEAKVFSDKDELILHATGSFFILKKRNEGGE